MKVGFLHVFFLFISYNFIGTKIQHLSGTFSNPYFPTYVPRIQDHSDLQIYQDDGHVDSLPGMIRDWDFQGGWGSLSPPQLMLRVDIPSPKI